jgi:hypothetical protein
LVVPAPDGLTSAIALYRDWPVGEFTVESVEMTLFDLRLDYPEPEVLAKMASQERAGQLVSTPP